MKHLKVVTIVLVIVAVAFVCVLIAAPGMIGLSSGDQKYVSAYFDPKTVNTVNISISDENWADILANPKDEEYHEASITINGDTYDGVAIRTKGMSSLSQVASSDSDRYSFKIKSDEYLDGQSFLGLNKFVLNNGFQDASNMKEYLSYELLTELGVPTPLYSYAAVYLNGEYKGLYLMVEGVEEDFAVRNFGMNYGQLYKPESTRNKDAVNGGAGNKENKNDIQGMMDNFKNLNENEKEKLFKNLKGELKEDQNLSEEAIPEDVPVQPEDGFQPGEFGGENMPAMPEGADFGGGGKMNFGGGGGGNSGGMDLVYTDDNAESYANIFDRAVFTNVSNDDKQRVITAIKNLNAGTNLEKYIDVDEVLRYFAVNTALVNMDSYIGNPKHNYYLYEENGKLSIIPWDWNQSFGDMASGTSVVNFPIDTPVVQGAELSERPLIGSLLAVDSYKDTYHEYLKKIATEYFGDSFNEHIDELDAMISSYVETDPTAFFTYDEYKSGIEYLKVFAKLRAASILGQLDGTIPSTWDGQTADSSSLIDTTELGKYKSKGGRGGGDFGGKDNMMQGEQKKDGNAMPNPPQ